MKGLVFTEFMEMVESTWSFDMVDAIIADAQPGSGGAYTAIGNYPAQEIVALISALAARTEIPMPDLIRGFGKHLFGRFTKMYPDFFRDVDDSFQFLSGIEDVIHAEVRKLYPDAELPTFQVERTTDRLVLTYFSSCPFADLAHGLIEGCLAHFGEMHSLEREAPPPLPGAQARFILTRGPVS
jgi:hypothetical protein